MRLQYRCTGSLAMSCIAKLRSITAAASIAAAKMLMVIALLDRYEKVPAKR